jgi:type II secretory pathway pseudopilin PulG
MSSDAMMPCNRGIRRGAAHHAGFALLELAVALLILTLLLGGVMTPLAARSEGRARQETDKALNDIRDALIGFAIAKGRLPCPAVATIPSGTSGAGVEARAGDGCGCTSPTSDAAGVGGSTCSADNDANSVAGVLPWATLGLPETDAWGRRYSYRINTRFGRDPVQDSFGCSVGALPLRAGFALCSSGHIEVRASAGGAAVVTGGVPAIAVSHGGNGLGAYTPQGLRVALAGASADEQENADDDASFVSSVAIDDRVMWIPTQVLMYRMLSAGMLP